MYRTGAPQGPRCKPPGEHCGPRSWQLIRITWELRNQPCQEAHAYECRPALGWPYLPPGRAEVQPRPESKGYCVGRPVMERGKRSCPLPLLSKWPSESPDHTRLLASRGFLLCFVPNTWVMPAILWAPEKCLTNGDMMVT